MATKGQTSNSSRSISAKSELAGNPKTKTIEKDKLQESGGQQKLDGTAEIDRRPSGASSDQGCLKKTKLAKTANLIRLGLRFKNTARDSFSDPSLRIPAKSTPAVENTYKTEPDNKDIFQAKTVENVVEQVLADYFRNYKYKPEMASFASKEVLALIMDRVKQCVSSRYKLVCNVFLGQEVGQDMTMTSRCIWEPSTDSFASASFRNSGLYVVATVHGVYFE